MKNFFKQLTMGATVGLVAAILVAFNFVVSFFPLRIDLTADKAFTLTNLTKKTVTGLKDVITVKAFISEALPARFLPTKQDVIDVLKEYETLGKGKIGVSLIDPKDTEKKREAMVLGVPELRFSDVEADKFQVSTGFLGLAIVSGEKSEAIPVIENTTNLEYDLTTAIRKVVAEKEIKIGFVTGHGEKTAEETASIRKLLTKQYTVSEVSLESEIDKTIKTLIILGPTKEFPEKETANLAGYLEAGGTAFFALEGAQVDNNLQTKPAGHNLFGFLEKYGVKLNRDLVVSSSNEIANFNAGYTVFMTPYPFWPKIINQGFNKEVGAVAKIDTLVLPWVSSLEASAGAKAKWLAKTAPQSWTVTEPFNLEPSGQGLNLKKEEARQVLIALLREEIGKDNGRMVVVGDADFTQEGIVGRGGGNAVFFQNLVDLLASDPELSQIRSRGASFRPIKEVSETEKEAIKWLNILGMPAALGVLGGLRIWKRSRKS